MKKLKYRILFLASWYPNRTNKVLGMFVRRKAETMAESCDVSLLYVAMDPSMPGKYDVVSTTENKVVTTRVYFNPGPGFAGKLKYNPMYVMAHYLGYKEIKRNWGLPDLVHVNVVDRAGYIALLFKWLKGFKYVITEHSTPDISFLRGESDVVTYPLMPLRKLVVRNAEFINVDSSASFKFWKKAGVHGNYGVIKNVVEVFPDILECKKEKKDSIKRAVHISALMERKNVADIIKAYAHIYHKLNRKNIEFHIIGLGSQKEELEKLASDLKVLNTCVFFEGYMEERDKLQMLINSDFHILNSDEEGFSVVTAESILYGVPVIATRCGGPEDFVPEEVGILIERRNPKELLNAILFMLDNSDKFNPEVLKEYGKNNFSPEVIRRDTYAVYEKYITEWKAGNTNRRIKIDPDWKVLDVGSGHQPMRRANVLLERYMGDTIHRTNQNVGVPEDKQMVIGDALNSPVKGKAFDYAIASHIAEHVDDPVQFCNELQRISKRGYLETPGPLTEILLPTKSHKWVIHRDDETLIFKPNPYTKPPIKFFYKIFYLNREGYNFETLKTESKFWKLINFILVKAWKFIPYAYTRIEWNERLRAELRQQ